MSMQFSAEQFLCVCVFFIIIQGKVVNRFYNTKQDLAQAKLFL